MLTYTLDYRGLDTVYRWCLPTVYRGLRLNAVYRWWFTLDYRGLYSLLLVFTYSLHQQTSMFTLARCNLPFESEACEFTLKDYRGLYTVYCWCLPSLAN
ncbi:hypothetical protein CEXT_500851 [Caerostris extrusa]|uniref:Uncharacterized protein n=1 Tax=Caerostris extrusa TaxID=172846 RepID=A0AAV4MTP8_CAEEX|nr:hypothetical protein CEXT_500851 [Caerostris extrusa]